MEYTQQEIIIAIFAATLLFLMLTGVLVNFIFMHNRKKETHAFELIEQQRLFEQASLSAQLEMQEQTMQHIAGEIHDNVGQVLLLAKLNLNKTLMDTPDAALTETRDLVARAIQNLRTISKRLHGGEVTDMPFPLLVERQRIQLEKMSELKVGLEITGQPIELDATKKVILLRILQEIIQNILKHSFAHSASITINFLAETLSMQVVDDGIGVSMMKEQKTDLQAKGIGLSNMQRRVKALRGSITFESEVGRGMIVKVEIPY